nr:MAG TPA: hypothetical protein [Caudoviricetes sp.]
MVFSPFVFRSLKLFSSGIIAILFCIPFCIPFLLFSLYSKTGSGEKLRWKSYDVRRKLLKKCSIFHGD